MPKIDKKYIEEFEEEIANVYSRGLIHAPVHLRKGREESLIKIFDEYHIEKIDYIFSYWDSHEICLLKGVPREQLKQSILAGNSIALCFPDYRILCSGIVGSLVGVSVGVAWALKQKEKDCYICHGATSKRQYCSAHQSPTVYHFCGEMSAETGIFYESAKYAANFDLPIKFIVCDNNLSVMTKTREVWNREYPWWNIPTEACYDRAWKTKIDYFKYTNGYPHSGLGKLIKF